MGKIKIIGIPWSLATIWNERLDAQPSRPLVPRNYLYASELGKSYCDRYLTMNAVPQSNPPNKRSKRKFTAGDCWEWLVGLVLMSSNMLQKKQVKVDTQLKGCLSVHGRLDFIAGGAFDYDKAMQQIELINNTLGLINMDVPAFFIDAADKFVKKYRGKILEQVIYECKTVSSFMMQKVQKTGPMIHHVAQNFHYTKGNEIGVFKGKLGYVCKDDCVMEEFDITDTAEVKKLYLSDIKQMTEYYNEGFDKKKPTRFMPPKEPEVVFEEGLWKFNKNWKVEYSPYLTYLYGYETPQHYGQWKWQGKTATWNNAFKKFVLQGQEVEYKNNKGELATKIITVTDNNREKRDEAIKYFPQWDKYVAKAKAAGAFQKPEEEGEDE